MSASPNSVLRSAAPTPIGVVVVDKPAGVTSHDVVARMRKSFRTRKVGHLGTLDPMATGVLPVTIGRATRLARYVPTSPKHYVGTIQFGWETTTADREGDPVGEPLPAAVDPSAVIEAMAAFTGTISQVPPAFSAKKIAGERAHRLARRGAPVELAPIEVTIELFEVESVRPDQIDFHVVCSGGTYIRSLARDLGVRLGTGGHLTRLRRTRSGPFLEGDAVPPGEAGETHVIPPEVFLGHLQRIEVGPDEETALAHGRALPFGGSEGDVCIFNKQGDLLAVAAAKEGWAHPRVVLL